jgi:hypothetical protein
MRARHLFGRRFCSLFAVLLPAICAAAFSACAEEAGRDLFQDTWVATDALGRVTPDVSKVGAPRTDKRRVVGIFYITWHSDSLAQVPGPYGADVSKILGQDPNARLDAKNPLWKWGSYHWGEPENGYFLSKDEYVIRQDMAMLADAGVDVLVMDVTNAVRYWDEWHVVFPVMQKMKAEGNRVPKFCFWAFNGPCITVVQDLYEQIYKTERYKDLWFYWDDKPLLLYNGSPAVDANGSGIRCPNPHYDPAAATDEKNPHYKNPDYTEQFYKDYTKEVKDFFTLRTMWWGYYEWAGKRFIGTEDNWSFGYDMGDKRVAAMAPDTRVSTHRGVREEAAVTPAQHPSSLTGKCWTKEHGEPQLNEFDLPVATHVPWLGKTVEHPEGYGIYFQDRWDEAIASDPQFLYINDWNEWSAGKYQPGEGKTVPFMRRAGTYHFVDQYNAEFNRCIQPMRGGYSDNYYMQMVENIRRYKGARPSPETKGLAAIKVDGDFSDWKSVDVEYRDTVGDTFHRDYAGYGGLHYRNDSGRNDIISCKVGVDADNVYFYAGTREPLTPSTGERWMLLLVDADRNASTGWCGYDFLLNNKVIDADTTTLMRYDSNSQSWVDPVEVQYACTGAALEVCMPRKLLGATGDACGFDFHWSDHPAELKDAISLCTDGDSAPNRRFNYRFSWKQ